MDPINLFVFLCLLSLAYYDIFNDRNVPDKLVYMVVVVCLAIYMLGLFAGVFVIDGIVWGSVFFLMFYLSFRMGLVGEAEAYVFFVLSLFNPYLEFFGFVLPSVLVYLFYSLLFFSVYMLGRGLFAVFVYKKVQPIYLILLIFYILIYFNFKFLFYIPDVVFLFLILSSLIGFLSPSLKEDFRKKISVDESYGEISVDGVVILGREIERFKREGRKEVEVYKYPAFLPFVLLSYIVVFF